MRRLERDRIDLLLLHVNEMPIGEADAIFDELERLKDAGKLRAFGWSTDYSESALAVSARSSFLAVEYAMNVFFGAPRMQKVTRDQNLLSLIRSPLAMGLLSGKYDTKTVMPPNDIRASNETWMEYFQDGKPNPSFMRSLDAVRELLMTNGRTLVQGALCWIWGQDSNNVPIPGARTEEQIIGLAEALSFGALPDLVMSEIEDLVERNPEEPDRPR